MVVAYSHEEQRNNDFIFLDDGQQEVHLLIKKGFLHLVLIPAQPPFFLHLQTKTGFDTLRWIQENTLVVTQRAREAQTATWLQTWTGDFFVCALFFGFG